VQTTPDVVSAKVLEVYRNLFEDARVQQALKFIESDNENTTRDQVAVTEIPAPPFQEETRGEYYKSRLEALGLSQVQVDDVGNVFGVWKGVAEGPTVFVGGHLDTVFPDGTDTVVREQDGVYYAPGISDNGRGLAATLSLVRALQHSKIQTVGDIAFGATVGEEGLGDLRGVKALFRSDDARPNQTAQPPLDGFISIEPGDPQRVTYLGTGSHRYRVTYSGPGGHSFGAFGTPSAIHALGRAIARIADLQVPTNPRTTFTVGEIRGGTSVNTIAAEASMMVDIRSNSDDALLELEKQVLAAVREAAVEENNRWGSSSIDVLCELVGDRPAGVQAADSIIVQAAFAATTSLGFTPEHDEPKSTDANVPISLGVPSLTLGGGGDGGGMHTLGEYFNPTEAHQGVQKILLTILGLVGVEAVTEPLLPKRS